MHVGVWRFEVSAVDEIGQESPRSSPVQYGLGGTYALVSSDEGTASYEWTDIVATGMNANLGPGDSCVGGLPVGFDFPLFGKLYDTVSIHAEGELMFGEACNPYATDQIKVFGEPEASHESK